MVRSYMRNAIGDYVATIHRDDVGCIHRGGDLAFESRAWCGSLAQLSARLGLGVLTIRARAAARLGRELPTRHDVAFILPLRDLAAIRAATPRKTTL